MIFAAAHDVIWFSVSRGGDTSTISIALTGVLFISSLMIYISSLLESPPASGVPVPGAKAGSSTSISSVI